MLINKLVGQKIIRMINKNLNTNLNKILIFGNKRIFRYLGIRQLLDTYFRYGPYGL